MCSLHKCGQVTIAIDFMGMIPPSLRGYRRDVAIQVAGSRLSWTVVDHEDESLLGGGVAPFSGGICNKVPPPSMPPPPSPPPSPPPPSPPPSPPPPSPPPPNYPPACGTPCGSGTCLDY